MLDGGEHAICFGGILARDQIFERVGTSIRLRLVALGRDRDLQRGDLAAHLLYERDKIEPGVVGRYDVRAGSRMLSQISDLDLAVRGQSADWNEPGLQACQERNHQLF